MVVVVNVVIPVGGISSLPRRKAVFSQSRCSLPYSPSLSLKTLDTGILVTGRFHTRARDYPSETSLHTVALFPTHTSSPIFSERSAWAAVHRLSGTDNPSSNCPSKLRDKVRRIIHSKFKLFHFQIKTYYLSDANHQTDNPSHTNNPSLV